MAQAKKPKKSPAKTKSVKRPATAKSKAPKKTPAKKASKPAVKSAARGKAVKTAVKAKTKAKPAPKAKARPAAKTAAKRPAAKPAAKAPAAKKRAVAASHRIQKGAVAVQPPAARPAPAPTPARPRVPAQPINGRLMTEIEIRRASESDYMNEDQMAFFRERLMQMRNEVLAREIDVKERLHQREVFADPADRASAEEEHWLDLRLRERESLLLRKIDEALRRIRDREYGYCEKTGEPIGIARLLARPTATVCVDIKGQDERAESQYRDR